MGNSMQTKITRFLGLRCFLNVRVPKGGVGQGWGTGKGNTVVRLVSKTLTEA